MDASLTVESDAFGGFRPGGLERGRECRAVIARDGYDGFVAIVTTDDDRDLGTVGLTRAG